ncbi:hypothetical protein QL285_052999 [Trifolium repens]|nr:hypothetical protein QL285_052999 [Trifolium repens]
MGHRGINPLYSISQMQGSSGTKPTYISTHLRVIEEQNHHISHVMSQDLIPSINFFCIQGSWRYKYIIYNISHSRDIEAQYHYISFFSLKDYRGTKLSHIIFDIQG